MKCIYCKKESEDKICYECLSEMNNILNYNEKCEHFNNVYSIFGLIKLFSIVGILPLFCSFIEKIVLSNFDVSFYMITGFLLLFITTFIVSSKFRFEYNRKIEDIIKNEMCKRHLSPTALT